MNPLSTCQRCQGFVPSETAACLHCGAPMPEAAPRGSITMKGFFCLAGAGVAAITLMACYGMPPCDAPASEGNGESYHCYDYDEPVNGDGGTDAGTDAGSDAGR